MFDLLHIWSVARMTMMMILNIYDMTSFVNWLYDCYEWSHKSF